jgi:hypothetical protein
MHMTAVLRCYCRRCGGGVTFASAESWFTAHRPGSRQLVEIIEHKPAVHLIRIADGYTTSPVQLGSLFDWSTEDGT